MNSGYSLICRLSGWGVTPIHIRKITEQWYRAQEKNNLQTKQVFVHPEGEKLPDKDTGREFRPYIEANWLHNTHEFGVK